MSQRKGGVYPALLQRRKSASDLGFKTDAEGLAKFEDSYKISGDSFYQADGKAVLPLGRLTIEETKAPVGLSVDPAVRTFVSDESGIYTDANGVLFTNGGIRITDEPVYGGVKILKRSLDQGEEPDGDADLKVLFLEFTIKIVIL